MASPSLNNPALKKYGLSRPDFNLNEPKRSALARHGEVDEGSLVFLHVSLVFRMMQRCE